MTLFAGDGTELAGDLSPERGDASCPPGGDGVSMSENYDVIIIGSEPGEGRSRTPCGSVATC